MDRAARDGPGPRMERMCENHDAMVAGGLAFAETRLKITDAQRPAWNKFATAVKSSDGAMAKRCADPAKMKPPANLAGACPAHGRDDDGAAGADPAGPSGPG